MYCRLILIILFLVNGFKGFSNPYQLRVSIKNHPAKTIYLAEIKGDKISPIDSISSEGFTSSEALSKLYIFRIPSTLPPGMYRLILGRTLVAEVLNEPPQQLDFIFNREDIAFEIDFIAPFDSLRVIQSEENKVWYSFQKKEKEYREKLKWAERELEYYRKKSSQNKSDVEVRNLEVANHQISRYNQLQKEQREFIKENVTKNPSLLASKLMAIYREPFLDGNLEEVERKAVFRNEFFRQLDFSDELLINTPIYTEKVFQFLMAYAQKGIGREKQEQEFIKAVDVTLLNSQQNQAVYEFILDYLMRGMDKLDFTNVLTHIAESYSTTCSTDEKTTLERRLASHLMKPGNRVPDFTLNDLNGDQVTVSHILQAKTLLIFWASWCPHCQETMMNLKEWYAGNSEKFEIIAVSIDSSATDWQQMVFDLGIESWYNLSDIQGWNGQAAKEYNVYATPTMFLIDMKMKILAKPVSFFEFTSLFRTYSSDDPNSSDKLRYPFTKDYQD